MSNDKTVTVTIDANAPRTLSGETKRRYDNTREEDIDYSEISDLGDVDWNTLKIEHPGRKPKVSMRLESDVIDYFKAKDPKGYTARMAAVLKAYVKAHQPEGN